MKKVVLVFLLFIVFITNTNAQEYIPMAVEDAQWVIYKGDEDNYPPFTDRYYGYKIQGDTIIINGLTYKKLYRRNFVPINPDIGNPIVGPYRVSSHGTLYAAIRDDIPNKKVYGIHFCEPTGNGDTPTPPYGCGCNEEFLMYDFLKEINEDITELCIYEHSDAFGYYIGDIYRENFLGRNRLMQIIYGENDEGGTNYGFWFAEGIGGIDGLFENFCIFECTGTSLVQYCVGTDQECLQDFLLSTNNQFLDTKISVYPNPTSNILNIDLINSSEIKIQIFNIYGKKVFKQQFIKDFITIDISNFTNGVYYLKINNKTTKVIKQ